MDGYLQSQNVDTVITAIKNMQKVSIVRVCTALMSKSLHKSGNLWKFFSHSDT